MPVIHEEPSVFERFADKAMAQTLSGGIMRETAENLVDSMESIDQGINLFRFLKPFPDIRAKLLKKLTQMADSFEKASSLCIAFKGTPEYGNICTHRDSLLEFQAT